MRTLCRTVSFALAAVPALLLPLEAEALNLNDPAALAAGGIENYWDRGNSLPNVVSLFLMEKGSNCTGTLINSRTILTAAHCVIDENTGQIDARIPNHQIRFSADAMQASSSDRALSGVLAYPGYQPLGFGVHDIALISLDRPVTEVTPVTLISANDPLPPIGSLVVISGYGFSGTGTDPDAIDDAKRRIAATNIGAYEALAPGATRAIRAQFRDPASPSFPDAFGLNGKGIPVPSLQAQPGPGDSGGPLFLVTAAGLVQIGTVIGGGTGYGAIDNWTSVQDYLGWLGVENPLRATYAQPGSFAWSDPAAWRDSLGRSEVPDNRAGGFAGFGSLGRYYDVTLNAASSVTVDRSPTIDSLLLDHAAAALTVPTPRTLTTLLGTTVLNGTLRVDGNLVSPALALTAGTLTGSGTVAGTVINAGGIVAPGGAMPGTLTIVGSYRQLASGTLALRLTPTTADQLAVTGSASLAGTLALDTTAGINPTRNYGLLTAAGGFSGQFAAVRFSSTYLFLDPAVSYALNGINIAFTRNATSFTSLATSANEAAVGRALDALPTAHPLYPAVITSNDPTATRAALGALSGDVHATAAGTLVGTGLLVRDAVTNRLAREETVPATVQAAFAADRPAAPVSVPVVLSPPRWGFWGQGFGTWGHAGQSANLTATDRTTSGFLLGLDGIVGDSWRLGLAGGYGATSLEVDGRISSASIDSYHATLYGGGRIGPFSLRLGGSYAWHDLAVSRTVTFPGFANAVRADYQARTGQVFGELGYSMILGGLTLEPFAGLAHVHLDRDRFVEQGGAAALSGLGGSQDVTYSTLGMRFAVPLSVSQTTAITAKGLLGWRHAFGDVHPVSRLSLAPGADFAVAGTPLATDTLVVDAELTAAIGKNIALGVAYGGQFASDAQDHSLKGNFTWRF